MFIRKTINESRRILKKKIKLTTILCYSFYLLMKGGALNRKEEIIRRKKVYPNKKKLC